MLCFFAVFGLKVSNNDKMLLDFESGVFGSFAARLNKLVFCSRCYVCNCLV